MMNSISRLSPFDIMGRYLARQFAVWLGLMLLALSLLAFMLEMSELMRRAAARPDATLPILLRMGLYKLPDTLQQLLPFVVLFAGLYSFWRLTRNSELVVLRAAGISVWQFIRPALWLTISFALFNLLVFTPIAASGIGAYKALETKYFDRKDIFDLSNTGLWLRQMDEGRQALIHASTVSGNPLTISPVMVLVHDAEGRYLERIDGAKATLSDDHWLIEEAFVHRPHLPSETVPFYVLATTLTLPKIQESLTNPKAIPFWDLPAFIAAVEASGFSATPYLVQFHAVLAQPFLLLAMLVLAACFARQNTRKSGALLGAALGIGLGALAFAFNDVVQALGASQALPAILGGWAAPLIALSAAYAALLFREEG